jgi:hypothetical protein
MAQELLNWKEEAMSGFYSVAGVVVSDGNLKGMGLDYVILIMLGDCGICAGDDTESVY